MSDLGLNCSGFSLGQLFGQRKAKGFCKIVPDPDLVFFSNMKARRYKEVFFSLFHTFDPCGLRKLYGFIILLQKVIK